MAAGAQAGSIADGIERLAKLRDKGLLDEEEFRAAKQALIARGTV